MSLSIYDWVHYYTSVKILYRADHLDIETYTISDCVHWKQNKSHQWLSGKVETGAIREPYIYIYSKTRLSRHFSDQHFYVDLRIRRRMCMSPFRQLVCIYRHFGDLCTVHV